MHSQSDPALTQEAFMFLEARLRIAKERREKSGKKEYITITRQTGAAGPAFFEMLKMRLAEEDLHAQGWMVFEKNLISRVIEENHMPSRIAEYMSEDTDTEIKDTLEELFGLHPARWTLVRKTTETMLRVAQLGHSIIVGRAGNMVTKKLPGGLHVQIVASLDTRIRRIQDFYRMDHAKAEEFVRQEDRAKKDYMKKYFNRDINDASLYDLVINTDVLCHEDAVRIISGIVLNPPSSGGQ